MRYTIVTDTKQEAGKVVFRIKDMARGTQSASYYMTMEAAERALRRKNERLK